MSEMKNLKREHIRFHSEWDDLVWISMNLEGEFEPSIVGLSDTESHAGAGFVVIRDKGLSVDDEIVAKIGPLSPRKSVVRWIKNIDESITRIGIEYLED